MLDLFRRVPGTASSAGWLWESLCHTKFREGGTFTLKKMTATARGVLVPSDEIVSISFTRLEPHVFNSKDLLSATRDPTKYFIPFSGSNPAFDSFFRNESIGVGLQMTLASHHTLNRDGLRMLYGRLGMESAYERWFVFIIRKGSVFKCQKPSVLQMKRFKFLVG